MLRNVLLAAAEKLRHAELKISFQSNELFVKALKQESNRTLIHYQIHDIRFTLQRGIFLGGELVKLTEGRPITFEFRSFLRDN